MTRLCALLCAMAAGCGAGQIRGAGQDRRPFIEHVEPGVLVVALGGDNYVQDMRDLQLKLITAAAHNGNVLVLASTGAQQANLEEACARYDGLCDRLYDGTVRVVVERHSTVWVRDFGPYINIDRRGMVSVLDAKYDDARNRREYEYRREAINHQRQALLEQQVHSPGKDAAQAQERDAALLRYGAELAQLYKDEGDSRLRAMDDDSPFYIAQAGLGSDRFEIVHPPIFLDGGNLFTLEDGTCLTSEDTVAKNNGDRGLVEHELATSYRCSRVEFLEALAGEHTIKHIDMFLMPVKNKTVLVASYDPGSVRFRERFHSLDNELRDLVVASAVAMNRNKLRLSQLGYRVVEVPSLFPRRSGSEIYFPTLLNGIVQVGRDRRRHLLLPDYDTTSDDDLAVKQAAREIIRTAFEPGIDIQAIESTLPARMQGALHCLTNVLPWSESVFAKDDGVARAVRDRISTFTPSSHSPSGCLTPMLGEWRQVRVGADGSRSSWGQGSFTMVIEPTATRMSTDSHEWSWSSQAVTCNPLRPSAALLKLTQGNQGTAAWAVTLQYNGEDGMTVQSDQGDHWDFVRPPTLLKIVQREVAAAKLQGANDALRQADTAHTLARHADEHDDYDEAAALYRECTAGLDHAAALDPAVSARKGPSGLSHAELAVRCKTGSAAMARKLSGEDLDPAGTEQGKAALDGFALASKAMTAKGMPALELVAARRAANTCKTGTGYLLGLRLRNDKPVYDGKTAMLGDLTLDDMHDRCTRMATALEARPAFGCGRHPVAVSQERASIGDRWGRVTGTGKQAFEAMDCREMPRLNRFPGASLGFASLYVRACGSDAIYVIQDDRWVEHATQRRMSGECWKRGHLIFHP